MRMSSKSPKPVILAAAIAVCLLSGGAGFAHVMIDKKSAAPGSRVELALRVGHGCSGSPTVKIRVRIPAGIVAVEAQPKAGWEVKVKSGLYDQPVQYNGQMVKEGAKEISWSGLLSPHKSDAFILTAGVGADMSPGSKIYFPIVQECQKGVERWIEDDEQGKYPAPFITVAPKR